jgi:uncharacterized membrane protein YkvA (DUF1232 family)
MISMTASEKLADAFTDIRETFFPLWDKKKEWVIKEAQDPPFDGCAIPMTKSILIHADFIESKDLYGVIIHEICHALSSSSHGKRWLQQMHDTAQLARKHGKIQLAEFIENDVKAARQAAPQTSSKSDIQPRKHVTMKPQTYTKLNLFMRLLRNLKLLLALIKDYWKGRYRKVSPSAIVVFLIMVIYFISPLDLLPDYLLGIGQIDDLAVLGAGLYFMEKELLAYNDWRLKQQSDSRPS